MRSLQAKDEQQKVSWGLASFVSQACADRANQADTHGELPPGMVRACGCIWVERI